MIRRGTTLLELAAYLSVSSLLLGSAATLVGGLLRPPPADGEAQRCDLACERLRRDLAAGCTIEGGTLVAGAARWTVADGYLVRDGAPRLRVSSVDWKPLDVGRWRISIARPGAPARLVEAGPEPAP